MRLQLYETGARLRAPLVSAHGEVSLRRLVRATVSDGRGLEGHGEAAPLESYDGVSIADVRVALEDCRGVLAGAAAGDPREEVLRACASAAVLPQAVAAIDLALWDLEGRQAAAPVWQLLGVQAPGSVSVNATIAAVDRAGAAAAAKAARGHGYGCVKLKVGIGDDAGRVAAVRAAAGPVMALRLDANGAWSPDEALAALRALAPAGIECCEEPCHGLEALATVSAQASVPVALDESARLPGALRRRVATAVCLKISACGGITGTLDAARSARAAGYEVYLASTLDGPLGIAAALHVAATVVPERPCGLATLGHFAGHADPLPPVRGRMTVPPGPGLGEGLLAWYA